MNPLLPFLLPLLPWGSSCDAAHECLKAWGFLPQTSQILMPAQVAASGNQSHSCHQAHHSLLYLSSFFPLGPRSGFGQPPVAGFRRLFLGQEAGWHLGNKMGWGEIWTIRGLVLK